MIKNQTNSNETILALKYTHFEDDYTMFKKIPINAYYIPSYGIGFYKGVSYKGEIINTYKSAITEVQLPKHLVEQILKNREVLLEHIETAEKLNANPEYSALFIR